MSDPARALLSLALAVCCGWGALALGYRAPGGRPARIAWAIVWSGFVLLCLAGLWTKWPRSGPSVFAAGAAGLLAWWNSLRPSNDRDWADDVARIAHGTVDGNVATVHNVRNFDWRSTEDYTPRWETRRYDLEQLRTLDMIMSYWSGNAIAHTLISFGFADGAHVVFSVEIRRERTEAFSEIGGFFKEFELSIIAADERDIVRLRTNIRRERTHLYRLRISRDATRALFLAYLEEANGLVDRPRFYHTLIGNCTIVVYRMLRRAVGPLPLSHRLWLSGYLPEYAYGIKALDMRFSLEQLRELGYVSERGRAVGAGESFSAAIRRGIPEL